MRVRPWHSQAGSTVGGAVQPQGAAQLGGGRGRQDMREIFRQ